MEDFRVDVVVGKGPGATAIPLKLPPFTLVGATTRAGLLPGPLRDRFGFTAHLDFYAAAELVRLLDRSARPARRTPHAGRRHRDRRALPRHAPHRQPAAAPGPRLRPGRGRRRSSTSPRRPRRWRCTRSTTSASTGSTAPCSTPCAGASAAARSGLSTLAVAVGEERETVEEVAEPFLVRAGLLARTPRGPDRHAGRLGAPGPHPATRGRPARPGTLRPRHGRTIRASDLRRVDSRGPSPVARGAPR